MSDYTPILHTGFENNPLGTICVLTEGGRRLVGTSVRGYQAEYAKAIREAQAEAWDVGYMRGRHPWTKVGPFADPIPDGSAPPQTGNNANPYKESK